jgi:hypothetical protein
MSYQTGYIYAIVNTIERVKIPQLQEAIQRLNEKTKLIQPNADVMKQVAKLDTDVATIMKKLNLVDGEFKDDDISLLQSLSDKLTTTVETVNSMTKEMTKIKNDYYHLINLEHLSTLSEKIEEVKEIAASLQNYANLSTTVNKNTTELAKAQVRIDAIDKYFDPLAVQKFTNITPTEKPEDKPTEKPEGETGGETGEGTELTGVKTREGTTTEGEGTTTEGEGEGTEGEKPKEPREGIVQSNMEFIISKIFNLMNLDATVGEIRATLSKLNINTIVHSSSIGSYIEKANIAVKELIPANQFELKTSIAIASDSLITSLFSTLNTAISYVADPPTKLASTIYSLFSCPYKNKYKYGKALFLDSL